MDFSITEDQQALAGLVREIVTDLETHERLTELESQSASVWDPQLWLRLAEAGITGITVPESAGGAGLGLLDASLVCHELGRAVAPVPAPWSLVTALVLSHRALAAVEPLLPGVAAGTTVLTAALEPGPGVMASRDGDGWVLTGELGFVPYAAQAGAIVAPATADDGDAMAVLLDPSATGVELTELISTNREPVADLTLSSVRVGDAAVVRDAVSLLDELRLQLTAVLCHVAAGVCAAALERTAKHTATREQFGKPIASFQAVGQRAADAYIDTELIRLTALQAVWRQSEGWPAREETAVAKWWAGDGGMRVLHTCQHLHGGLGVDLDYPLHRYFLWGKQLEHRLGTPTRELLELGNQLAALPG